MLSHLYFSVSVSSFVYLGLLLIFKSYFSIVKVVSSGKRWDGYIIWVKQVIQGYNLQILAIIHSLFLLIDRNARGMW